MENKGSYGGGFALGFLLGIIGVIIAICIGGDDVKKGAGIGCLTWFVCLAVIGLIAFCSVARF